MFISGFAAQNRIVIMNASLQERAPNASRFSSRLRPSGTMNAFYRLSISKLGRYTELSALFD